MRLLEERLSYDRASVYYLIDPDVKITRNIANFLLCVNAAITQTEFTH